MRTFYFYFNHTDVYLKFKTSRRPYLYVKKNTSSTENVTKTDTIMKLSFCTQEISEGFFFQMPFFFFILFLTIIM
jgi:hypothetical protein